MKCESTLKCQPYHVTHFFSFSGGYFKSKDELHHVEGFLLREKEKKKFLFGNWTETFCSAPVDALEEAFGVKAEKVESW